MYLVKRYTAWVSTCVHFDFQFVATIYHYIRVQFVWVFADWVDIIARVDGSNANWCVLKVISFWKVFICLVVILALGFMDLFFMPIRV